MRASAALTAILFLLFAASPAVAEEYGSVTGIVTSANNAAVPDALVTLWEVGYGTPMQAVVPNNPQFTSNYSSPLPGLYTFTHVRNGTYNVTAVWGQYWYYTTVTVKGGTATANIVIPAYINASAVARATPVTYYTYVPLQISSPLPQATTRSPGFEALAALLAIPLAALARKRPRK